MKRLLENIILMSAKAVSVETNAESAKEYATGVQEMALAYAMLKDVEIHEKFHTGPGEKLPGETVIPFKPN